MAKPVSDPTLEQRLRRLRGGATCECLPEYQEIADRVRKARNFPSSLARFKALADEHRLVAMALLKRRKELCACEIQAATGLNHATVSHHMSVLVHAGLVSERRAGKWIYYRLRGEPVAEVP